MIVISIVTGMPHGSTGVNVYELVPAVDVFIVAGDQDPVKPLSEVDGSAVGVEPTQNVPNVGNVGVTASVIVICMVTGCPHGSVGVKV